MTYVSSRGDVRVKPPIHRQALALLWSLIEGIYLFFYLLFNPSAKLPKYKEKSGSSVGGMCYHLNLLTHSLTYPRTDSLTNS